MPKRDSLTVLRDHPEVARIESNIRLPNANWAPENDHLDEQIDALSMSLFGFIEEQTQFKFSRRMKDYVCNLNPYLVAAELNCWDVVNAYTSPDEIYDTLFTNNECEQVGPIPQNADALFENAADVRREWTEYLEWEKHFEQVEVIQYDDKVAFYRDHGWDIATAQGHQLRIFRYFERQIVVKIAGLSVPALPRLQVVQPVDEWEANLLKDAEAYRSKPRPRAPKR